MRIAYKGFLYETTEETKDQYVIRFFAERIANYMQGLSKEFNDVQAFNREKAFNIDDDEYPTRKKGIIQRTAKDNEILDKLDKNAKVRRTNNDITTSLSQGDKENDPEMKLGHFSAKRYDEFNNRLGSEGEAKYPVDIKSDEDDNPQSLIPIKKIINEKSYKNLIGLMNGKDHDKLSDLSAIQYLIKQYKKNGGFVTRSSESSARHFNIKIAKKLGYDLGDAEKENEHDIYYNFLNYVKNESTTRFVDMIYNEMLILKTGEFCYPAFCFAGKKARGQYSFTYNNIYVPFFEKSKYESFEEKLIMLRVLPINKPQLVSILIHELTHALDNMNNSSIYSEKEGEKEYRHREYEQTAFTAQIANDLEISLRKELVNLKKLRDDLRKELGKDYWFEYNQYVSQNNFLYDLYKNEDSFVNGLLKNKKPNGDLIFDIWTALFPLISHITNDSKFKEDMIKKIKPWFDDLKNRYKNVIPSKQLPFKKL